MRSAWIPVRFYPVFPGKRFGETDAVINGSRTEHFALPGKEGLQAVSVNGRIGNVKWTVDDTDSLAVFYAATMDPQEGVVVDNFSTRGSSGQQLRNIPYSILADYNRLRTYDLIVLQYGLNVASEKGVNYSYYKDAMIKVVAHLKAAFPQAGILIVGVGDRENKNENGDLRTMPGVKNLIRYQQALAAERRWHSGIFLKPWVAMEALSGWWRLSLRRPIWITHTSTSGEESTWPKSCLRH